ncbi:MAG: xanthine permease [Anaerolineae bacterium]|nr:xanthine permease [Anaerolineae bacterium]
MAQQKTFGYLPQDRPNPPALVSLGLQHVLTMFPATVLVALLTGFDVAVTLFASGLATFVAILGSRGRIPMYYGSSFSYIAAVYAVVSAEWGGVQLAQAGIVVTGILNILVGLIVRAAGKDILDRILPPIVTGSVAIVIGISLAKTALDMASGMCQGCVVDAAGNPTPSNTWWLVAMVTLVVTILFSVYLRGRGLLGMLPVLLGAVVGYAVALVAGLVDFAPVNEAAWLAAPSFTLPDFANPNLLTAVLAIAPIAIATIPESTAHLYQISLYIDRLADQLKRPKPGVSRLIGLNLVLDGIGDTINGLLGGCAGTNYGENNSLMAITRNYSSAVLAAAGVIAMLLAFVGKLGALVGTLPTAVTGGLAIYLFGVIALQGVALMMAERVNLFDPRQLAIGAAILVVGIGGSVFEGGCSRSPECSCPR